MSGNSEAKVFLSYRRDDAEAQAGRLYDRLNVAFPGRIFRDLSGIHPGVDFNRAILEAIAASAVMLPMIGRHWLTVADAQGEPRIAQANDYVRLEIATGLRCHLRTIPVLVDGARMPAESDLPSDIKALSGLQAVELLAVDYDNLVNGLIEALQADLGPRQDKRSGSDDLARQVETLAQRSEASIAMEDWMAAIQTLQAARQLDPANAKVAERLRFAQEQMRLGGWYADGQASYQKGDRKGALERFRQVRVMGGGVYKNVDQLIAQIEAELRGPLPLPPSPQKSRWMIYTVGGVVGLGLIGMTLQPKTQPQQQPVQPGSVQALNPTPVDDPPVQPAPRPSALKRARPAVDATLSAAADAFVPRGRWEMYPEVNPYYGMAVSFNPTGQFVIISRQGNYQFPGSAGDYEYDSASGMLILSGVDNLNRRFQSTMKVMGKHGDHFHVWFNNTQWAMRKTG